MGSIADEANIDKLIMNRSNKNHQGESAAAQWNGQRKGSDNINKRGRDDAKEEPQQTGNVVIYYLVNGILL